MAQKHWLVIGVKENWCTALQQPIPVWGLKDSYYREFRGLSSGDFIWMYVTKPVSGIIGAGIVRDTYIDRKNLIWREELEKGSVIWPLRFRMQILKVLPVYDWETAKISIKDFSLMWQRGFQQIPEDMAMEIFTRSQKVFSAVSLEGLLKGPSINQIPVVRESDIEKVPEPVFDSHSLIQNQIAEIGKLQSYHTQLEYPLSLPGERKNIDVVWKREISGVPTFVFEIELSGMIEKAIDRLEFALNQWNSRPRLVVPEEIKIKVTNKINLKPAYFSRSAKLYNPEQIADLLEKKRQLRDIERELELY
ncbi:MAG: hypothetical protein NC830_03155 [Candidatus Omnitrophica bacterium]|nr:hypothetical protein [Candidatus Omnitrophota bacterium]